MGNLMRRYWVFVMSSSEIAAPDGRNYACKFWVKNCWHFAKPRAMPV